MTIRRHLGILLILPIVLATTSCGVSLPLSDLLFPNRDGGSSTNLTPAGSGGKAGALREGNFRNGAEFLWTLDAEDVGGGRWEMPHDDPTTGLAAGPIVAGGVWLANVIPAGSGLYEANTLVALDPARGEVIWSKEEAGWEDCVAGPGGREFLCVFDDGRVAYLDPESGVERVLLHAKQGARSFAAATADGAVVIQETGGLTLGIHGVAPDGTERYAKTIDLEAEAVYDFKPLSALGGQAQFSGYDESIVFDLATGAEQGRFRGSVWLTGKPPLSCRRVPRRPPAPPGYAWSRSQKTRTLKYLPTAIRSSASAPTLVVSRFAGRSSTAASRCPELRSCGNRHGRPSWIGSMDAPT